MQIYHVITSLDVGGAENALKKLCLNTPRDIQVNVIVLNDFGIIAKEISACGIPVISLPVKNPLYVPVVIYKMIKMFRKNKPDIVQTWLYHSDFLGGIAARAAGVKNVLWGVRTTELKKGAYLTSFLRKILSIMSYFIPNKIIFVAEASKKFHESIGYSNSKSIVIGNGFEYKNDDLALSDILKLREDLGIKPDHIVIGSVGRFSQDKGQDLFVAAAGLLSKKHDNLTFVMVGRGNDRNNSEIVSLINATGFGSRFILLGERSDLSRWYSLMDIYCLHSRTEGFPNVLGEAMMFKKPCVVTRAGDAEFVLGNAGIIASSVTIDEIASALSDMICMPHEQRASLGVLAHCRIRENFSLESVVSKYVDLYKTLVVGS